MNRCIGRTTCLQKKIKKIKKKYKFEVRAQYVPGNEKRTGTIFSTTVRANRSDTENKTLGMSQLYTLKKQYQFRTSSTSQMSLSENKKKKKKSK